MTAAASRRRSVTIPDLLSRARGRFVGSATAQDDQPAGDQPLGRSCPIDDTPLTMQVVPQAGRSRVCRACGMWFA